MLSQDGRMTITELASRVGLSNTPCHVRFRRLVRDGFIQGFRAVVDPSRMGLHHVAFTEVKLSTTSDEALKAFNPAVRSIPEIEACHMTAGRFDYLLKVRTEDIARYRLVLGERISSLPHVADTSTSVVLEVVKENRGAPS
ncbi:Lrp/AsnC family transcriptional regulator [Amaricoccus sp.]|uniref:Lrp/AsnC family transcriptional regulator n=1 Tax=Amaricoccus sp. TaxID=1872485 RepID=UPI00345DD70E